MPFFLWRQDDNGNRFLVGTYADRNEAEARMAELSRYPHRQTYWISTRSAPADGETGNREVER